MEKKSVKLESKYTNFIQENAFENVVCKTAAKNFVLASMC